MRSPRMAQNIECADRVCAQINLWKDGVGFHSRNCTDLLCLLVADCPNPIVFLGVHQYGFAR